MLILAVDTSTVYLSVFILDDSEPLAGLTQKVSQGHAGRLLPAVATVLDSAGISKHELDCLVVCRGPGSFSGLRIGIASLTGLAAALGLPLLSFVSLDLLALQFVSSWRGVVCPLIDARKSQVYWAAYTADAGDGRFRRLTDYQVDVPAKIFTYCEPGATLVVGPGVDAYRDDLTMASGHHGNLIGVPRGLPDLTLVSELLRDQLAVCPGQKPAPPLPLYIRPSDAEMNLAKRR